MATVRYETDGEVAILTIDNPPVNALAYAVRVSLSESFERALVDAKVKAVVLICAGRTFSAGADFTEFSQSAPKEHRGRQIVQIVEASAKPVIAALHGTALGGGFELAMSCHWRIAHRDTKIGLPEVNIGVIPGGGGTQRTPRLAGPEVALEMTTSGEHYEAAFGLRHGMIDELVDGDLRTAAIAYARRVVSEGRPLRVASRMGEKLRDVNPQIFADFRKKIEKRARGLIAPWKCIDAIEAACSKSVDEWTKIEQAAFEECRRSPQRAALTHLFQAEREARKVPDIGDAKPMPIRKAAIVGSGTMGGGIAMCFANAGIPVALIDISEEAVRKGMSVIEKNYASSVERGSTAPEAMRAALALIKPTTDYGAVGDVDIVIEAIVENMALKKEVFAKLDELAPRHAILTSNTSSLDIDEIASSTTRPEKVVGTHFFSPANVMKLLENVRGKKSSGETIATVMNLHKVIGKIVVLAGNCNSFIGNRMFQFYNTGWEYLMEEGATPEQIDRVAVDFGFAMGPCAVRDLAGIDVAVMVRAARAPSLPKEERLSPILERLVAAGRYGQKSGAGVYKYEGRKQISDPATLSIAEQVAAEFGIERRKVADEEIMPRMLYPMINEGAKILEEGIALRAGDIDVMYCYAYGFPKHLGGPMYWAQQQGFDKIIAMMKELSRSLGPRYRPAPLLERLAASRELI